MVKGWEGYRRELRSVNVWSLLDRMKKDSGATIGFLEKEYWSGDVNNPYISVVLARLEEEGLVKSHISRDDIRYKLTLKGRELRKNLRGSRILDYNFFVMEPKEFPEAKPTLEDAFVQ